MEYTYTPTPEGEAIKAEMDLLVRDNINLDTVDQTLREPLFDLLSSTITETASLLDISDYGLVVQKTTNEPDYQHTQVAAETHVDIDPETNQLVSFLRINPDFFTKFVKKENPQWEYDIARCIAHEAHHIREHKIAPSLMLEIPPYFDETLSEQEAWNVWRRYLPEYASELFAYNYLKNKFKDRQNDPTFQRYINKMKTGIDTMSTLIKKEGRSYGAKDTELAKELEDAKKSE